MLFPIQRLNCSCIFVNLRLAYVLKMFYRIPETRSEGLGEGFSPKSERRSDAPHAILLDNARDINLFLFCYTYVSKIHIHFKAKYPDTVKKYLSVSDGDTQLSCKTNCL